MSNSVNDNIAAGGNVGAPTEIIVYARADEKSSVFEVWRGRGESLEAVRHLAVEEGVRRGLDPAVDWQLYDVGKESDGSFSIAGRATELQELLVLADPRDVSAVIGEPSSTAPSEASALSSPPTAAACAVAVAGTGALPGPEAPVRQQARTKTTRHLNQPRAPAPAAQAVNAAPPAVDAIDRGRLVTVLTVQGTPLWSGTEDSLVRIFALSMSALAASFQLFEVVRFENDRPVVGGVAKEARGVLVLKGVDGARPPPPRGPPTDASMQARVMPPVEPARVAVPPVPVVNEHAPPLAPRRAPPPAADGVVPVTADIPVDSRMIALEVTDRKGRSGTDAAVAKKLFSWFRDYRRGGILAFHPKREGDGHNRQTLALFRVEPPGGGAPFAVKLMCCNRRGCVDFLALGGDDADNRGGIFRVNANPLGRVPVAVGAVVDAPNLDNRRRAGAAVKAEDAQPRAGRGGQGANERGRGRGRGREGGGAAGAAVAHPPVGGKEPRRYEPEASDSSERSSEGEEEESEGEEEEVPPRSTGAKTEYVRALEEQRQEERRRGRRERKRDEEEEEDGNLRPHKRSGGDLAYWLWKLDAEERLEACQVVALIETGDGQRVTGRPPGDANILAWSVVANDQGLKGKPAPYHIAHPDEEAPPPGVKGLPVAYFGDVNVRFSGQVKSGELLFATDEGTAAVAPAGRALDPLRFLGKALKDGETDGTVRIRISIMDGTLLQVAMERTDAKCHVIEQRVGELGKTVLWTLEEVTDLRTELSVVAREVAVLQAQMASMGQLTEDELKAMAGVCRQEQELWERGPVHADSEDAAKRQAEAVHGFVLTLEAWLDRVTSAGPSLRASPAWETTQARLRDTIRQAKERASRWEEVGAMLALRDRAKQRYRGFRLEVFNNPNAPGAQRSLLHSFVRRELDEAFADQTRVLADEELAVPGQRVRLVGEAGIGKSTLCRWLCQRWAEDRLRRDQRWDLVVLVSDADVSSAAEGAGGAALDWEAVLARAWFDGGSREDARRFLGWAGRPEAKVLWIVDGYDAVEGLIETSPALSAALLCRDEDAPLLRSAIIATQPERRAFVADRSASLRAFSDRDAAEFVSRYFGAAIPSARIHQLWHVSGGNAVRTALRRLAVASTSVEERITLLLLSESSELRAEARTPGVLDLLCFAVTVARTLPEVRFSERPVNLAVVFRLVVDALLKRIRLEPGDEDFGGRGVMLEQGRRTLRALAWANVDDGPLRQVDGLPIPPALLARSGILQPRGHALLGMYIWRPLFRAFLAAEWLLHEHVAAMRADQPLLVVLPALREVAALVTPPVLTFLGALAAEELDLSGRLTLRLERLAAVILSAGVGPHDDSCCGRAVVKAIELDRMGTLRTLAIEAWRRSENLWAAWRPFVAGFGGVELFVSFFGFTIDDDALWYEAGACDNLEVIAWLLSVRGVAADQLLGVLYSCEQESVIRLLLERGADPNDPFSNEGTFGIDHAIFMRWALRYAGARITEITLLRTLVVWIESEEDEEEIAMVVTLVLDELTNRLPWAVPDPGREATLRLVEAWLQNSCHVASEGASGQVRALIGALSPLSPAPAVEADTGDSEARKTNKLAQGE